MLGLELMMAGMLMAPQNPALHQVVFPYDCKARRAPQINVRPSQSRIKYDFTKSKAYLNTMNTDTISPYGPAHKGSVSGLMSGSIGLKSKVMFSTESYAQYGMGCLYLKGVDVEITVNPKIYVASDFPQGGCMHNAILAHEMKHVNEDQYVVNKYINEIGKSLSQRIEANGAVFGPIKLSDMSNRQEAIQSALHDEVRYMNEVLNAERRQRQQDIDSLEEYQSIGVKCKSRNKSRRR